MLQSLKQLALTGPNRNGLIFKEPGRDDLLTVDKDLRNLVLVGDKAATALRLSL